MLLNYQLFKFNYSLKVIDNWKSCYSIETVLQEIKRYYYY